MTGVAILLVVVSAFAHSGWNFLTKRARNPEIFTWSAAIAANLILLPVAVYLLIESPPAPIGWAFMAGTWSLHLAYFTAISRAYRDADLSLAYPIARGTGLLLIPVLGVFLLGERMALPAVLGVALIAIGIFVVSFGSALRGGLAGIPVLLRQSGVRYALATGVIICGYSIIDKKGVAHVSPVLYMYFLTSAASLGMPLFLRRAFPASDFVAEWKMNGRSIVLCGLLQFGAYALVLTALQVSKVSYVAPFREIGIVIGVLLGALLLDEPFKRGRVIGASLIVCGAIAIALSP